MIRRTVLAVLLLWAAGFGLFLLLMPGPADDRKTDAIVVLTGGAGRIDRGLALLRRHAARRMLVSGVPPQVARAELAAKYPASSGLFACCVDLGHEAVDTRSNADETAVWLAEHGYRSVRLVTSEWHLARAEMELNAAVAPDVTVLGDGVKSSPRVMLLLSEYNKLLVRRVALWIGVGD